MKGDKNRLISPSASPLLSSLHCNAKPEWIEGYQTDLLSSPVLITGPCITWVFSCLGFLSMSCSMEECCQAVERLNMQSVVPPKPQRVLHLVSLWLELLCFYPRAPGKLHNLMGKRCGVRVPITLLSSLASCSRQTPNLQTGYSWSAFFTASCPGKGSPGLSSCCSQLWGVK